MNYRRRPWCSDHRQLVTCRQADRLVRLISKCNRTLSKISSPSICVELSRFPQNCFSRTLHTVWLNLDHESTGPHLASIIPKSQIYSQVDLGLAHARSGRLDVCQRILSDRPVSSNIWHSPDKPSSSSFCARVYRFPEQLSYVRFAQRRKLILETVVLRYCQGWVVFNPSVQ